MARGRKPYPLAKKQQLRADWYCKHIEELVGKKRFTNALTCLTKHGPDITAYYGDGILADLRDQITAAKDGVTPEFQKTEAPTPIDEATPPTA